MNPIEQAIEAMEGFLAVVNDSRGVAGYHLNSDTAAWGEFDEVEAAEAAITALKAHQQAVEGVELPPLPFAIVGELADAALVVAASGLRREDPLYTADQLQAAIATHQARQGGALLPAHHAHTLQRAISILRDLSNKTCTPTDPYGGLSYGEDADDLDELLSRMLAAPAPEVHLARQAVPQGFALVSIAQLSEWKQRVNTLACQTLKRDRHVIGAELKTEIADVIAAPLEVSNELAAAPAAEASQPTQADPRCAGCDIANGCPEYCRCQPTQAAGPLGKVAKDAFDSYWHEDSKGEESEAWAEVAQAVIAAQPTQAEATSDPVQAKFEAWAPKGLFLQPLDKTKDGKAYRNAKVNCAHAGYQAGYAEARAAQPAQAEAIRTLTDFVERTTHWQEGGADRHAAKLALKGLASQPTQAAGPLGKVAKDAFDSYWHEDSKGEESEAWAEVAQAVIAAQPTQAEAPATGRWISADDVDKHVLAIDVSLNGLGAAAKQASIIDIRAQVEGIAARFGKPVLAALATQPPASQGEPISATLKLVDEYWCHAWNESRKGKPLAERDVAAQRALRDQIEARLFATLTTQPAPARDVQAEAVGNVVHLRMPPGPPHWSEVRIEAALNEGCDLPDGAQLYAGPQAEQVERDREDAERWRYAIDWGTKGFAVCRREGMDWTPIKTSGPLDAAREATKGGEA